MKPTLKRQITGFLIAPIVYVVSLFIYISLTDTKGMLEAEASLNTNIYELFIVVSGVFYVLSFLPSIVMFFAIKYYKIASFGKSYLFCSEIMFIILAAECFLMLGMKYFTISLIVCFFISNIWALTFSTIVFGTKKQTSE